MSDNKRYEGLLNEVNSKIVNLLHEFVNSVYVKYEGKVINNKQELLDMITLVSNNPSFNKVASNKIANVVEKKANELRPEGGCIAVVASGDRKGKTCGNTISNKSTSGKYCSHHLSNDLGTKVKPVYTAESAEKDGKCCATLISGKNKGGICGAKVHVESLTGKYCKRHIEKYETDEVLNEEKDNDKDVKKDNDKDDKNEEEDLQKQLEDDQDGNNDIEVKKEAIKIKPVDAGYSLNDGTKLYYTEIEEVKYAITRKTGKVEGTWKIIDEEKKIAEITELTSEQKKFLEDREVPHLD